MLWVKSVSLLLPSTGQLCLNYISNNKFFGEYNKIYRWFSIRSRDNLGLVIPNNKTIEHGWLGVLFMSKKNARYYSRD